MKNYKKVPPLKIFLKSDLIVSFGFRKILKQNILKNIKIPIFNIHLSYLPYNRGAHPNFWSFMENTPSGVSIHEINEKIDAGNIIIRKKIYFDIKKNKSNTFRKTYNFLKISSEKLFKKNFYKIVHQKYRKIKNYKNGSFHYKKNLPKIIKDWDENIILTKKKF